MRLIFWYISHDPSQWIFPFYFCSSSLYVHQLLRHTTMGEAHHWLPLILLPEQITEATCPDEHSDAPRAVTGQSPMCFSVPLQWNMCLQTWPFPFPKCAPSGVERATPHLSCWHKTWASSMSQWELQRDPQVPRTLSSTLPSHWDLPFTKRTSVYPGRKQGFKKMSVIT